MANPPRMISDSARLWRDSWGRRIQIAEVTIRTQGGLFLLTPTKVNERLIMGVFGKALEHYLTDLYGVFTMGNHLSYLAGFTSAKHQADFMQFVHANIARELGWHGDYRPARPGFAWKAGLWGRRGKPIPALTDEDAVARLKYGLSNGVKERLVRDPRQMGGAHSGRALCTTKRTATGHWVDRTLLGELRKRHGARVPEHAATTTYEVRLAMLPHLRHLGDVGYRDLCVELCAEVMAEAEAEHGADYSVLGVKGRRAVDPMTRPESFEATPAPLVHCHDKETRAAYIDEYRAFVEAYQLAFLDLSRHIAAGRPWHGRFPPGGIPPGARIKG